MSTVGRTARAVVSVALLSSLVTAWGQTPTDTLGAGPWTYDTYERGTHIRVSVVTKGLSHP